MLRVRLGQTRPSIKVKYEFKADEKENYVEEILSFSILNKSYFVVSRHKGLLQMYEKQKQGSDLHSYKLVKEWKNSTIGTKDRVVAVGCFRNQFMYTCSSEGKLVIRDLINDDADDSVKCYLIDLPVHCVQVQSLAQYGRVLIAAGGRNNELKLYDLDYSHATVTCLRGLCASTATSGVVQLEPRSIRRAPFSFFHIFNDIMRLTPLFIALDLESGACPAFLASLLNLVSTVLFLGQMSSLGESKICAGTQFGDLLVFVPSLDSSEPIRVLKLSRFPINSLHLLGDHKLLYTDLMSKIGIIDTRTWTLETLHDYLRIGPTVAIKIYSKVGSPKIYVLATTILGTLVIYRLQSSYVCELKLSINGVGIIPAFDILDDCPFDALEEAFSTASVKKRKLNNAFMDTKTVPITNLAE